MSKRILTYTALLLFMLSGALLSAQNVQDLDAALDRYEDICNQCFSLRERLRAGETVDADAFTPLLERLSDLRETLGRAKGEMNFEQLRRFDSIRERYARAFKPALLPDTSFPVPQDIQAVPDTIRSASEPFPPGCPANRGFHPRWHVGIHAFAGFPVFAPGVMVTADNTSWGLYTKGSASVRWVHPAYAALSDGTSEQGTLWTTGKERRARFGVSAGGAWFPVRYLGVYAGGGYGEERVYWEDTAHDWVTVTDLTKKGILLDTGLLVRWRRLSAFAGVSSISFRTIRVETGLGVRF